MVLGGAVFAQTKPKQKVKPKKKNVVITPVKGEKLFSVSGNVTRTESYCGGVELSPGEYENYHKPQPYSGKVFYVRKGKVNDAKQQIVASFTTNSKGEFKIELPPGEYSIIVKEQAKPLNFKEFPNSDYLHTSEECLKEWWAKPLHVLLISDKEISGLKFNFHWPCFVNSDIPCIRYNGPLPP